MDQILPQLPKDVTFESPDLLCAKAGYCLKRASFARKPGTKKRFIEAARRYWALAVTKADRDAKQNGNGNTRKNG